jgi:putative NIF3 family GTP cyclohydrolase 1 type 2
MGRLTAKSSLHELAQRIRSLLACGPVQVVGDPGQQVATVALSCGAAGSHLKDAVRLHADVFLTGEMRFHDYLSAKALSVALILPGHYATERLGVETLAEQMQVQWSDLTVTASQREKDPVGWV